MRSAPQNLPNVGNSCYISATIAALFAPTRSLHGLLTASARADVGMRQALTRIADGLADGGHVSAESMRNVVQSLQPIWRHDGEQHDAAEFVAALLDGLRAPFQAVLRRCAHVCGVEHSVFTERVLWVGGGTTERSVSELLDDYFACQVVRGLRRGSALVDASVTYELMAEYCAGRETGETTMAERHLFDVVTVVVAIRRFAGGEVKTDTCVGVEVCIPAERYVQKSAEWGELVLALRSVVCHRGESVSEGHYVAYTRAGEVWTRWDDGRSGEVERCGSGRNGLPVRNEWRVEIECGSYLLLYDLVERSSAVLMQRCTAQQVLCDGKISEELQLQEDERMASAFQTALFAKEAGTCCSSFYDQRRWC